jgi:hypothetical protein
LVPSRDYEGFRPFSARQRATAIGWAENRAL